MARIIFILSMFTRITGAAMRPVVTFTPIWNKILCGDSVTMTCDVEAAMQGAYTWYRNNERIHTGKAYTIHSARSQDSGDYQCGSGEGGISDAVTLNVTQGPVVLQAPPYIYEGHDLLLRCHSGSRNSQGTIVFYRNNEMIHSSTNDSEILYRGHRDVTAVYRCTRQLLTAAYSIYSDETDITAQGSAPSVMMTFNPNWRKIFTGDSITMTCNGNLYVIYHWYRDNRFLIKTDQNFMEIPSAQRSDSGTYQCRTSSGNSPLVRLDVSDGPVILQAPLYVHDGHILYLRCRSRPEYSVDRTRFYKDDKLLQDSEDGELSLRQGDVTGRYRCERRLYTYNPVHYSDSLSVPIRDLFSSPDINLTRLETTEGDNLTRPETTEGDSLTRPETTEGDSLTLTCDTRLSPRSHTTELHFAFYRDGEEVQGFNSSNKYVVLSAQLEDSGNYSCTARTSDGRIWKTSEDLHVQIQEMEGDGWILYLTVSIISLLILIVSALLILRHRHHITRLFQKRSQTGDPQPDVTEADGVCYTTLSFPIIASPRKVTESVVYSAVRVKGRDS